MTQSATERDIRTQFNMVRKALPATLARESSIHKAAAQHGAAVIFTGCGSSYYIAQSGAAAFRAFTRHDRVQALPASEVTLYWPYWAPAGPPHASTLIPISRSGDTSETISAIQAYKERTQGMVMAVTCAQNGEMARTLPGAIVMPESDEPNVVMTRSATSMLYALTLMGAMWAGDDAAIKRMESVPEAARAAFESSEKAISQAIGDRIPEKIVYLGGGPFYGLAEEGKLKVKEMSLASSEAYHPLEFRHGPMSMADSGMLIVLIASDSGLAGEAKLISHMKSFGVRTLVIHDRPCEELACADYSVFINSGLPEHERLAAYLPVLQLIAVYITKARGLDPDHPRNLSKVVVLKS
ncbi:MAG: SIS domain-containing protein [Clostridia bacterium]|nr:SIS domain-containing protein [Clostridia bacterium]